MDYEYIFEPRTESGDDKLQVGCDVLACVIPAEAVNMQLMRPTA